MSQVQALFHFLNHFEWIGMFIARLTVGLLFLLSGASKLFTADRREQMFRTLEHAGIPWPRFNATVVSGIEGLFGSLLLAGAVTPLSCVMLGVVMIVAIATTRLSSIRPLPAFDWLSSLLYFPEVLYLVILLWLFFSGPGAVSLDYLIGLIS